MFVFNRGVFVKGKVILGFCNLAAIWLETQAAQERARESARIFYIHANFVLFSYILYLKIYCMYVYVRQELAGHEDIEQNLNDSPPPAVSRNTGYLPTHHLRHIAHVCVCMWEVLQSTPVFYHTFLRGNKLTFS